MGGETLGCIEIQPEQATALASLFNTEKLFLQGLPPTRELWRFAAGLRLVTVLLCASLLVTEQARREHPAAMAVWLVYALWAGGLFWFETTGRTRHAPVWPFWVDVAWACLAVNLLPAGPVLLAVLLGQPVVLVSIGQGLAQGLMLAAFAAVGMGLQPWRDPLSGQVVSTAERLSHALVLALVPALAVLTRPLGHLGRRLALVDELETQLDPRRGLGALSEALVDRLRRATQADVVALVLPSRLGGPAALASRADGGFQARMEVHMRLEALLAQVPARPVSHFQRRRWDPRPSTVLHPGPGSAEAVVQPPPAALAESLGGLCQLLDVASLHVVPLTRYAHSHGYFVVGCRRGRRLSCRAASLDSVVTDMLRTLEQAALVDQLQEESAAHERARIGRDLHDSAIQPYLGLKFAVEAAAQRIPPDNPARDEVEALAALVTQEVAALRELISGMRTGQGVGDDALMPAVRRQARRFTGLFGIEVQVDGPGTVATSRALASAVVHMVNEALNNVRKHAGAQRVWLHLSVDAAYLRLSVRDDGGSLRGQAAAGFRPASLCERAAELGGSLELVHPDGLDTEILIQIPLTPLSAPESSHHESCW